MFSLRPITARVARRFIADGFDRGAETVEIDPAARVERPPVLFLPDELERIVGHHPGVTAQHDLDRLLHADRLEPATTAQILHDVTIADGTLMRRTGVAVMRDGAKRKVLHGSMPTIAEAMLCVDSVIDRYFGHWVADGWSREQLAIDRGLVPGVFDPARFAHGAQYRPLLGLPAVSLADTRVRRLWMIDDRGYNPGRMARFRRVRTRLRRAVDGGGPQRLFIRRGGQAAGRHLLNEAEVVAALTARGFAIVAPEELPARAVATTLRDARLVVGVEGSALSHANAVVGDGACVFAIQSPTSFNSIHRLTTADAGLRFAFSVGDVRDGEAFTMPVERLSRAIDMVEQALR
jgi:hypothetical protein